jgi:hypothetical protein
VNKRREIMVNNKHMMAAGSKSGLVLDASLTLLSRYNTVSKRKVTSINFLLPLFVKKQR